MTSISHQKLIFSRNTSILVLFLYIFSTSSVTGNMASFALDRVLLSEWKLVRLFLSSAGETAENSELFNMVIGYVNSFIEGTNLKIEDFGDDCMNEEWCYRAFADHPIYAFKLVKRYALQLPPILGHADSSKYWNLSPLVVAPRDFPDLEDVESLADGLLTLQQIYKLDTIELAAGKFPDHQSVVRSKLDQSDSYHVALRALKLGYFSLAQEWADFGQQQQHVELNTENPEILPEFSQLKKKITEAVKNGTHANFWQNYRADKPVRSPQDQELLETFHNNLTALCSGKSLQPESERSSLFCWLETNVDHYSLIRPLKFELHSKSPFIVQVHEAVGSELMHNVEQLEQSYSERQSHDYRKQVLDRQKLESQFPPHVSYHTEFRPLLDYENAAFGPLGKKTLSVFLAEEDVPSALLQSWPRTVKQFSRLEAAGVERGSFSYFLGIQSYNFDGKSNQHFDLYEDENETRIATALSYMSRVQLGGATVYPKVGVTIPAVHGSMILHFNLYREGLHLDPRTLHYGCPPVIGRKRMASKFLVYQDQMQNFKCGLGQWDLFDWDFMKNNYNPAVRSL